MGRLRAVALAAVAVFGSVWLSPIGHGAGAAPSAACAQASEPRDRWNPIHVPAGTTSIAEQRPNGCDLLAVVGGAVMRTRDGGATWRKTYAGTGIRAVFAEQLGPNTALVSFADGRIAVSHDAGSSYRMANTAASPGGAATAAAADPADRQRIVVAREAGGSSISAPTVLMSQDGGATFLPVPGSVAFRATALAFQPLPGSPVGHSTLWVAADAGAAPGLFSSVDGQSFVPRLTAATRDVTVTQDTAGGVAVLAATASGVQRSDDGGQTFRSQGPVAPFSAVRSEPARTVALMAVSSGRVYRAVGPAFLPSTAGLPGTCVATGLQVDAQRPGAFVLRCVDDRWFGYQSSGYDLGGQVPPPNPNPNPLPGPGTGGVPGAQAMTLLRTISLPVGDGTSNGSLAFDGRYLYYAGSQDVTIHRISPIDGHLVGDLGVYLPQTGLTYDARRNQLDVTTKDSVYAIELTTGRSHKLFDKPRLGALAADSPTYSYDSVLDEFRVSQEYGSTVWEVAHNGKQVRSCSYALPGAQGGGAAFAGTTGVVSDGAGGVYVEMEDDMTVVRVDRTCHLLSAYEHATFSEAGDENDALACDTVTFYPAAAIWIRDAGLGMAEAFAVPAGFCPIASQVAITPMPVTRTPATVRVCAVLSVLGSGQPIRGALVNVTIAGQPLLVPPTDAAGRACAPYSAPLLARGARAAVRPAVVAFLGNSAYQPARARSLLRLIAPPPPRSVPPVAAVVPPVVVALAQPPPAARPPVNGASQPGPQANPQVQSQVQSQSQASQALATSREEEHELVLAHQRLGDRTAPESVQRMSRPDDALTATWMLSGCMLLLAMSWGMMRRTSAACADNSRRLPPRE
jgi:hypothetical protein